MRSEKCAPDCSESTFGAAPDLCGRVRTADAAPTLVDLVRRSCYAGLQPAATKGIGTAARRKAMGDAATLLTSRIAAAEVAKRIVTAARK